MDKSNIVGQLGSMSTAEQQEVYRDIISVIPSEISSAELGSFLSKKPQEEKSKALATLTATAGGVSPPLGLPTQKARDKLWLIVVIAFAIVLVGGFITLAVGVFLTPAANGVKPELILTTFTSVVGFLAGLFVPSPAGRNENNTSG